MKVKTKDIILCALFAALTGVLSQISIPLPFTPVPINLATIGPFLAGGLLGAGRGAVSQAVYAILGIVGIPVFAGFTSGLGILVGPTGGYILGYVAAAMIVGLILGKKSDKIYKFIIAMVLGLAACYGLGTMWFMFVTGNGVSESLLLCVVPFLPGDVIKIMLSSYLALKLKKQVQV